MTAWLGVVSAEHVARGVTLGIAQVNHGKHGLLDDELWQGDEGDWHPWRRRVRYAASATPVPIADLRGRLELTGEPNWGYRLSRGLIPLSDNDFVLTYQAMTGSTPEGFPAQVAPLMLSPVGLW